MTTDKKPPCGIQEIIPDEKYISQGKNPRRYYREEQYNELKSHADKLQAELDEALVMFEDVKSELKLLYSDRTKLESRLEKCEGLLREARDFLSSQGYLPETIDQYFAEVEK